MKLTTYLLAIPALVFTVLAAVVPGHFVPWLAISLWGTFLYAAHEDLADILGLMLATTWLANLAIFLVFVLAFLDGTGSLLAAAFGLSLALGLAHFKAVRARVAPALARARSTTP